MTNNLKYDNKSRSELIKLLHDKNKQIDSQRSMLNQLRASREVLKAKVKEGNKTNRQNEKYKSEIEQLEDRLYELKVTGKKREWLKKETIPVQIATILGYHNLYKETNVSYTKIFILILGYQSTHFFLPDIEKLFQKWGYNPGRKWRKELRELTEKGVFYSNKAGHNIYYYMSYTGRDKFEILLNQIYECNNGLNPVKVKRTFASIGLVDYFF